MEKTISYNDLPDAISGIGKKLDRLERILLQESRSTVEVDKLFTVKEAAAFLHLTPTTIYCKVSKGELPVMKQGKRLYFSRDELIAFIKTGRKKTANAEVEDYLSNKKKS